ncbi:hypothetical protein L209DRAFT_222744 [Thermothelomyces heterothallicus CBS 203.75]
MSAGKERRFGFCSAAAGRGRLSVGGEERLAMGLPVSFGPSMRQRWQVLSARERLRESRRAPKTASKRQNSGSKVRPGGIARVVSMRAEVVDCGAWLGSTSRSLGRLEVVSCRTCPSVKFALAPLPSATPLLALAQGLARIPFSEGQELIQLMSRPRDSKPSFDTLYGVPRTE